MATMIETLPVEIQDHAKEMEKHLHEFLDNLGAMRIEEAIKNEKGYCDSVIAMIKWYVAQNANKEKITSLKEVLAVTMYRLECTRKLVEKNGTIEEAKAVKNEIYGDFE